MFIVMNVNLSYSRYSYINGSNSVTFVYLTREDINKGDIKAALSTNLLLRLGFSF